MDAIRQIYVGFSPENQLNKSVVHQIQILYKSVQVNENRWINLNDIHVGVSSRKS